MGINYNKFYRWYKEVFSSFRTAKEQENLHKNDLTKGTTKQGKPFKIRVPIFRPEHIGQHMAIDEKHIGGIFYTVLTNAQSSRVALMMASVNAQDIGEVLKQFSTKLSIVQSISRDLSPTYQSIADEFFPQAEQVADKYHIIAKAIESVQEIRIRLKQEAIKTMRLEQQEHNKRYRYYLEQKKRNPDKVLEKVRKKYIPERLKNGETKPELLARSKYLLYKYPDQWNIYQKNRATILFEQYPEIKDAFNLKLKFREWYKPNETEDKTWNFLNAETGLLDWIYTAEQTVTAEVKNFINTVENNFDFILNYHRKYQTNAIAESINAKIKKAIRQNNGTRDRDFFHFRLNLIL